MTRCAMINEISSQFAIVASPALANSDSAVSAVRRSETAIKLLGGRAVVSTVGFARIIDAVAHSETGARLIAPGLVTGAYERLASEVDIAIDRISINADDIGLSQIFWGQVDGSIVISNSAFIVMAGLGAQVDEIAVGMLAHVGFLFGGRSLFTGVYRCEAGQRIQFTATDPVVRSSPGPRPTDVVGGADPQDGVRILRTIVEGLLSEHPNAVTELSGGLDSRALIAAMPAELRCQRLAVTLGASNDPDVRIARRVAASAELQWRVVDPAVVVGEFGGGLLARGEAVALKRGGCANVPAAVTLDICEASMPTAPRFTGANGEYARGFYYPGVLTDGPVTARRVRQLAKWRLFTNDGRAAQALTPELAQESRHATLHSLERELDRGSRWRRSTDEFYLTGRMANWAGPGYSIRPLERPALAPFFHANFRGWADSLPARSGARNLAFARLVNDLDPSLAQIPLDGRPSVAELSEHKLAARVRSVAAAAQRGAAKVGQRVTGRDKPPEHATSVARLLVNEWSDEWSDAITSAGVFNALHVDSISRGATVDSATVSLAINVATARRFSQAVAASP